MDSPATLRLQGSPLEVGAVSRWHIEAYVWAAKSNWALRVRMAQTMLCASVSHADERSGERARVHLFPARTCWNRQNVICVRMGSGG